MARLPGGRAMVSVPVVMHAVVLSLVDWGVASAFASAFPFGASVMAAACAVTVFVQKTRPSPAWTANFGQLTVCSALDGASVRSWQAFF
jgi:hypothetical protein